MSEGVGGIVIAQVEHTARVGGLAAMTARGAEREPDDLLSVSVEAHEANREVHVPRESVRLARLVLAEDGPPLDGEVNALIRASKETTPSMHGLTWNAETAD
jgi:hypothetical protein